MAYRIAQDDHADQVLGDHPFALLTGMALDQQFPMERAFAGPAKLLERLGSIEPADVAAADPEQFASLCAEPPAIHRFPGSMAGKVQGIARVVVEEYDGDTARLWEGAADAKDLLRRLTALPGFGKQKAQIFIALLAKQAGCRPAGWEEVVGDYALEGHRSVADVVDEASLGKVRAWKQEQKAAAKAAAAKK